MSFCDLLVLLDVPVLLPIGIDRRIVSFLPVVSRSVVISGTLVFFSATLGIMHDCFSDCLDCFLVTINKGNLTSGQPGQNSNEHDAVSLFSVSVISSSLQFSRSLPFHVHSSVQL